MVLALRVARPSQLNLRISGCVIAPSSFFETHPESTSELKFGRLWWLLCPALCPVIVMPERIGGVSPVFRSTDSTEDMKDVGTDARHCVVHNLPRDQGPCPLRPVDSFGSGFSCTSFSSLNNEASHNTSAVAEGKATCH